MEIRKRHIIFVLTNFSPVYFSFAATFSWHDLANNIYSQTAKTVFSHINFSVHAIFYLKAECTSSAFQEHFKCTLGFSVNSLNFNY